MKRTLFHLYSYNDIDHIVPVIWKMLVQGEAAEAVMLDPFYRTDEDPRLVFLSQYEKFQIRSCDKFSSLNAIERFLKKEDIRVCVFEWGESYARGREPFFKAAMNLKIPKVALPHGLTTNFNPARFRVGSNLNQESMVRADCNCYEAYVFQSTYHQKAEIKAGMRKEMLHVLGSARFCDEWVDELKRIYPSFENKKRMAVMLPHWKPEIDKVGGLQLIRSLNKSDNWEVRLKEHTRKGTGDLPELVTTDVPSFSLIQWASCVLNFGSSIGLDAILLGKPHIVPKYLISEPSIFDSDGVSFQMLSPDDFHISFTEDRKLFNKSEEIREILQGPENSDSVLNGYIELIKAFH